MVHLEWDEITDSQSAHLYRTKVFGGWLVKAVESVYQERIIAHGGTDPFGHDFRTSICFVPDPGHQWGIEETDGTPPDSD